LSAPGKASAFVSPGKATVFWITLRLPQPSVILELAFVQKRGQPDTIKINQCLHELHNGRIGIEPFTPAMKWG
jgi:hypothetical protein